MKSWVGGVDYVFYITHSFHRPDRTGGGLKNYGNDIIWRNRVYFVRLGV